MDMPPRLGFIVKRILRELRALSEAVSAGSLGVQKQISSIRDQQEAANQQREQVEQRPQILNAELQIPEAVRREKRTSDNRHLTIQSVTAVATVLAFIAAAVYAGIAARQLKQMKIATEKEGIAADAAKNAADIAAQTMKRDQRAWVKIDPGPTQLVVGSPIITPLNVSNIGKTPAENVRGIAAISIIGRDETPQFVYEGRSHGEYWFNILFQTAPVPSPVIFTEPNGGNPVQVVATQPMIDQINNGDEVLLTHGEIAYNDAFGIHHWFTFCYVVSPPPIYIFGALKVRNNKPSQAANICGARNAIDHND